MTKNKIIESHCNLCAHPTKHTIVTEKSNTEKTDVPVNESESFEVFWTIKYLMLECCGCGDISLKRLFWFSEDGPDEIEVNFYPPRVSRRKPEWFDRLPEEYKGILNEIYSSLHADNRCLSAMGARTVIDLFIVRKVGDSGDFKKGLKKLVDQGYITNRNKETIESAIEAGHAATHRAFLPTTKQLDTVMDIVESLIRQDLLEDSAASLKKEIPVRTLHKKA